MYTAIQKGIFKKHGIEVERVAMPGGAKVLGALLTGDIDVGFLAAASTLQAQFQDRPIKIIGISHAMEIYSLLARNDLKGTLKTAGGHEGSHDRHFLDRFRKLGVCQSCRPPGIAGPDARYQDRAARHHDVDHRGAQDQPGGHRHALGPGHDDRAEPEYWLFRHRSRRPSPAPADHAFRPEHGGGDRGKEKT